MPDDGIYKHFLSSACKIGPKSDSEAVVDERLKVYGVNGLRVVDVSIMPKIVREYECSYYHDC